MTVTLFLSLVLALATPWFAGYLLFRGLSSAVFRIAPHLLTRLGLGFFLGQLLVLAGLGLSSITMNSWSIWPALLLFFLCAVVGWLLHHRNRGWPAENDVWDSASSSTTPTSPSSSWLQLGGLFLIALCLIHLAVITVEVSHRPVFPWDGWLNWMYRAKAWFYADAWLAFDTPAMWLAGERSEAYAVAGRHYPPLLPVTAVWMALTSGGWSETLINLPTVLAGLALVFSLSGLAKDAGLPAWAGALAAYLFISLPLVGTHLSLAGMADIWMAGYAGLGFACLLLGLQIRHTGWLCLGIALVLISRLVKLEGSVWLLAALLASAVVLRPKWSLMGASVVLILLVSAKFFELHALELPLLGIVGIVNERLVIPFIGSYALADWQLLDDYRDNFLQGGSWHLLWPLLLVTLGLLLRAKQWREAGVFAVCLGSGVLATLFIFQFTENGAWAEDWSAINRLPLHLTPILILGLVSAFYTLLKKSRDATAALTIVLTALGLTASAAGFFWESQRASKTETGAMQSIAASELNAVIGAVKKNQDGSVSYTDFQDGVVVLASSPLNHPADSASLVTIKSSGENREALTLFWSNSNQPQVLHTVFVDDRGDVTLELGDEPGWEATIVQLGITAFDDGKALQLEGLVLGPNNAAAQRSKALVDWLTPNSWSQRSVNWVDAGAPGASISLPGVMVIGVVLCAILALILPGTRLRGSAVLAFFMISAIAWMLLDARWIRSQHIMAKLTQSSYPLLSASALDFGGDIRVKTLVDRAAELIDANAGQSSDTERSLIVIGSEDPAHQFQRLRARYHLLPRSAVAVGSPAQAASLPADYAILIKSAFRDPKVADTVSVQWMQALKSQNWRILDEQPRGALLGRQEQPKGEAKLR